MTSRQMAISLWAVAVRGDAGTDWQGSLRARIVYAFDRTLIYKTAGWAVTNAHVDTRGNNQERTINLRTICCVM